MFATCSVIANAMCFLNLTPVFTRALQFLIIFSVVQVPFSIAFDSDSYAITDDATFSDVVLVFITCECRSSSVCVRRGSGSGSGSCSDSSSTRITALPWTPH